MDYGTFNGLYTLFIMLIFFGIVAWAYSKKRHKAFTEAANLVFADDPDHQAEKTKTQGAPKQ
jgi:cytochrome c oxidase cbb3-type subunit 4